MHNFLFWHGDNLLPDCISSFACLVEVFLVDCDLEENDDHCFWFDSFFHYSIYLRFLIESCMYIFVSYMLELSQSESIKEHRVSYIIAILGIIPTLLFILIPVHYFAYRKDKTIDSKYLAEVYEGLKDTTMSKLYIFIFILRRFSFEIESSFDF